MRRLAFLFRLALAVSGCVLASCAVAEQRGGDADPAVHLRHNLLGYQPSDRKVALAFSHAAIEGEGSVVDAVSGEVIHSGPLRAPAAAGWGRFAHYAEFDFSAVNRPGEYRLRGPRGAESAVFRIGDDAFGTPQADLLGFMRQQRCGYNPLLDMACHRKDGRTAYGPRPAGSFVDASGGWHDAGDQLKYLITGSNATARMLLAYELAPAKFGDRCDALGRPRPNGLADVLDEARWGLDWMHKLHPTPTELYHQVADDRDHNEWKWPNNDTSDYGWGKNSYRVVYAADGRPQGLSQHKSESTGVANLAGRCAAAMAMAARVWGERPDGEAFAARCRQAAIELYRLGRANEGFQQGNSYKAPYRYAEDTWADDMEWGAAELFKLTGEDQYLSDAKRYAELIGATSWMPHETAGHYQFYPFLNVGHFALYPLVGDAWKEKLAGYYREGLDACAGRADRTAYGVGAPFIWCSNNLVTALATQALLYERMTGDDRYRPLLFAQRDWLLGRNPWGTSMFTGLPRDGERPIDVHTGVWKLARIDVPGGLVDGPVYASIYRSLIGIKLNEPDEFAEFQNDHVVYHDDFGDYSTNEPTMDGTAGAIYLMAHFGADDSTAPPVGAAAPRAPTTSDFTRVEGGIVRGPRDSKRLALVFTGGEHGEGTDTILDTLAERGLRGSFFVTGDYLAVAEHTPLVRRMIREGHYVGPHSHGHPLLCPWDDRGRSLVTEEEFKEDLRRNLTDLRTLGACRAEPVCFIPPYEWYNARHAEWASEVGCLLVNNTPGSGSHRDWAPEGHQVFRASTEIVAGVLRHEASAGDGLNGHLLLMHLGSQRRDKMAPHIGGLIDELLARGYQPVRVDELVAGAHGTLSATADR